MSNPDFSKLWLASFANTSMGGACRRLGRQAKKFGFLPEHIRLFDETNLAPDFLDNFKSMLISGSRGFGYWCWKPQIVLQMMDLMQEDEILLYLDAGCHLNNKGKARFWDYADATRKYGICGFQSYSLLGEQSYSPQHHLRLESEYTKGDIFDFFGVRNQDEITSTAQFWGGCFFVKKTKENLIFFQNYGEIIKEHTHLLSDSPSITTNLPGFIENRHDQSLFSVMLKLRHTYSFSSFECEFMLHHAPEQFKNDRNWGRADFDDMQEFPIHARRDKTSGLLAYIPITVRTSIRKLLGKIYHTTIERLLVQ